MLITISPAKALDLQKQTLTKRRSTLHFMQESERLVVCLRKYKAAQLSKLMGISNELAELNRERFSDWRPPFTPSNSKQAILAFRGQAYVGLNAGAFSTEDFQFAQEHLRIPSGLYGLLRPLDLMQPYRLEMGRQFACNGSKHLYEFWGSKLTRHLKVELNRQPQKREQQYSA